MIQLRAFYIVAFCLEPITRQTPLFHRKFIILITVLNALSKRIRFTTKQMKHFVFQKVVWKCTFHSSDHDREKGRFSKKIWLRSFKVMKFHVDPVFKIYYRIIFMWFKSNSNLLSDIHQKRENLQVVRLLSSFRLLFSSKNVLMYCKEKGK